jgi:O-antigen/teichoic acid export membrane protein
VDRGHSRAYVERDTGPVTADNDHPYHKVIRPMPKHNGAPISPSLARHRPLAGDVAPLPRASSARQAVSTLGNMIASKSFASVFDQAVVSGTSFFTSVIIGRMCSLEDLGVYALALSVARFVGGVQSELVCSPYVVYSVHRRGEALATYVGSTLVHHLLLTALSVLSLLGLAGLLTMGGGSPELLPVVWGLVGSLPFLLLRDYLRRLSLAHLRMGVVLAVDVSVAVLQLGGLLLLGYCQLLSVSAAYIVWGTACGLACLGWFVVGGERLKVVPGQIRGDWRLNWSFSRWSLAGFLVGTTTPYFMPWILAAAHGEAATGVLAACSTLVNCVSTYVTGITNVVMPRAVSAFAQQGAEGLRVVLRRTVILFIFTVGAFCLFIFASGDWSVCLLYGNKYAGCGLVLALLALNALANSLSVTAGNGLWALDRPKANFLADVCALVVTWATLWSAIGPLGAVGAALALVAGAVSGAAVRAATLQRLLASYRCSTNQELA